MAGPGGTRNGRFLVSLPILISFCLQLLILCHAARKIEVPNILSGGQRLSDANVQNKCGGKSLPAGSTVGSVVKTGPGRFRFSSEYVEDAVATGAFVDSSSTTSNFGKLRVSTSGKFSDEDQFFALGFMEGYLTAARIYDNYVNVRSYFNTTLYPGLDMKEPLAWLHRQDKYARDQVAANQDVPFWRVQGYLLRQLDGMVEGYEARYRAQEVARAAGQTHQQGDVEEGQLGLLSRTDLMFLNGNGDLYDVIDGMNAVVNLSATEQLAKLPAHQLTMRLALSGKCSALIKVAGDLSDLFIGHSTWDTYTSMLRIFKHYNIEPKDEAILSHKLSFSSYPGELASDDDFYITDTGLVALETTNHIFDDTILLGVTWRSALSWQRVRAALLMADSGEAWLKVFSTANSGTYNNQYMVVDLKRFVPRQELAAGVLWVVEQLPGKIQGADLTDVLGRGYWPSYNVPYFPEIYNASGYASFVQRIEERGEQYILPANWLKYQIAPRANIFRRDQGSVTNLQQLKDIMRTNKYKTDPYAKNTEHSPLAAVCGRGDLDDASPDSHGCYDGKVTSWSLALKMQAEVVNGPTMQGGLPAFSWEDARWSDIVHRGMPQRFQFDWERMDAADLPLPSDGGNMPCAAAGATAGGRFARAAAPAVAEAR